MSRARQKAPARRQPQALLGTLLGIGRLLAVALTPFGIDRSRFLAMLEVKFRTDFARGRHDDASGQPKLLSGQLALTLALQAIYGLLLAGLLLEADHPMTGLFWTFTVIMVMVTMTLMTEQASALFETQDLQVLGPLPVDGRTVLAARIAHLLVYFVLLVGSLGGFPMIAGAVRFGPLFPPVFGLALLLGTATCLSLAILLLVAALHFATAARVRSLLMMVQVLGGAGAILAWQLVPQTLGRPIGWLVAADSPWPWLLPPAHSASLVLQLLGAPEAPALGLGLLAVAVPVLLMGLIALAARRFQERLLAMAAAERGHAAPPRRRWCRDLLLRNREAILGYDFAAALCTRDRQFRMRAWPPVLMGWVLAAWQVWSVRRGAAADPAMACISLYILGMATPQVMLCARFSDDWQARQVFRHNPLRRPGQVVAGAMLALALRFTVPAVALTTVVVLLLGGPGILPDILFALLVIAVMQLLSLQVADPRVPFTEKFKTSELQGSLTRSLLFLLVAGVLAVLHVVLRSRVDTFYTAMAGLAALTAVWSVATVRRLRHPDHVALVWRDERA